MALAEDFTLDIPDTPADLTLIKTTLIELAQAGDKISQQEIILTNMGLILLVIRNYFFNQTHYLSREEMIQEGVLGLYKAIEKFDPSRGTQFSTYAFKCIKTFILRAVNTTHSVITLSKNRNIKLAQFFNWANQFLVLENREPSIGEIKHAFGLDEEKAVKLQIEANREQFRYTVSLQKLVRNKDENGSPLENFIPDHNPTNSLKDVLRKALLEKIYDFIFNGPNFWQLKDKIQAWKVLTENLLGPKLLKDIAKELDKTTAAISATKVKLLKLLKENSSIMKELEYLASLY
jgi:RNA polymerase sigma factor (sigma-70 family)